MENFDRATPPSPLLLCQKSSFFLISKIFQILQKPQFYKNLTTPLKIGKKSSKISHKYSRILSKTPKILIFAWFNNSNEKFNEFGWGSGIRSEFGIQNKLIGHSKKKKWRSN